MLRTTRRRLDRLRVESTNLLRSDQLEQRWKYDEALFISIKSAGQRLPNGLSQVVQHSAMK